VTGTANGQRPEVIVSRISLVFNCTFMDALNPVAIPVAGNDNQGVIFPDDIREINLA